MPDDCILSLVYALWLAASTMPLGFMLGSSCSLCCPCHVADGKPRTDPKDEGTWVPSGTWRGVGGVTWSFTANPGDDSGETWFFYGSAATSRVGGGATIAQREDWQNICNWYSSKTTSPSTRSGLPGAFDKRAIRFPPENAVVHVYTNISTVRSGPKTVKNIYFWGVLNIVVGSEISTTTAAHDSAGGAVLFAAAQNSAILNGGASLVGGGFFGSSTNAFTGVINQGAMFDSFAFNAGGGIVNGGGIFYSSSQNGGTVNDGATFYETSLNSGTVNNGATFNDSSQNGLSPATVNGGATFNDAACSSRTTGDFFATPCTRKFVAHPTDLPTCNGTAPAGCDNQADICGCN